MSNLTKRIREYAFEKGARVVGIADADSLEVAPQGHRPKDLLKDTKM